MADEFPITREIVGQLDGWVHPLAEPLIPAVRVPNNQGGFRWEFRERTPRVVMVAKSVRMVSGIRAGLFLADNGFTTESGTMLRAVSDFAHEIMAIAAGLVRGECGRTQQKFVEQFFVPFAQSPEEFEDQERQRYVSRQELGTILERLAAAAGQDLELLKSTTKYLNYGYDSYVHGAYSTAMELYRGDTHTFMLRGVAFESLVCSAKTGIAGKLYEVVSALELFAVSQGLSDLQRELADARERIDSADEQDGGECRGF